MCVMKNIAFKSMILLVAVVMSSAGVSAQQLSPCEGDCEWEHMMQNLLEEPAAVMEYDIMEMVSRADLHHLSYMSNTINYISPSAYENEDVARRYADFLILLVKEYGRKSVIMKEISEGREMIDLTIGEQADIPHVINVLRLIVTISCYVAQLEMAEEEVSQTFEKVQYGNMHFLERVLYGGDVVMAAKDPYYSEVLKSLCGTLDIEYDVDTAEDAVLQRVTIMASENDIEGLSMIWKGLMRLRMCINMVWQQDLNSILISYAMSEKNIDGYLQEFGKALREYFSDEFAKMMIPLYSLRLRSLEELNNVSIHIQELIAQEKPYAEYLPWACPEECRVEGFEEYREVFIKLTKILLRMIGYEMDTVMISQAQETITPMLEFFGVSDINHLLYVIGNFALELLYEGNNDAYTIIEDMLRLAQSGLFDINQLGRIAIAYTNISYAKVEYIIDNFLCPSIEQIEYWEGGTDSEARIDVMLLASMAGLAVNKEKYMHMADRYASEAERFITDLPYDAKELYADSLMEIYSIMGRGDMARSLFNTYYADLYDADRDSETFNFYLFRSYHGQGDHESAARYVKPALKTEGVVYALQAMETAFMTADYRLAEKLAENFLHNRYNMAENMLIATPEDKSDLNSMMKKAEVEVFDRILGISYEKKSCSDLLAGILYDWNLISKGGLLRSMQNWHSYMMDNDDKMFGAYDLYNAFADGQQVDGVFVSGEYAALVSYELSDLMRKEDTEGMIPQRVTCKEVVENLSKGSFAIEFCGIADDYYAVMAGNRDKAPKLYRLCSREDIMNVSADVFTEYLYDDDASLRQLYDLVWEPVLSQIPEGSDIYCSLDGILNLLNVELFCDESMRYVGDIYDIHRVSTTASIRKPVRMGDLSNAVLYGNMNYSMNQTEITSDSDKYIYNAAEAKYRGAVVDYVVPREHLGETGEEIRYVADLLCEHGVDTLIFEWNDGTEFSFKSLSGKDFDILHMATHGFWWGADTDASGNQISPMRRSGLVLSGSDDEPLSSDKAGVLFAQEIAEMDLSSVDLLVLSACQTAGGEIQEDGVFGLQRGFKQAGVGTIVMTLWPVNSVMTQSLMTGMYENMTKGQDAREAFYNARTQVRKQYKKASDWGAFIILD